MDVSKPLLLGSKDNLNHCDIQGPVLDERCREKSLTPEVRVEYSSDVNINTDPGVTSPLDSPSDDAQSEKLRPHRDGRLVKSLSEQLPTIICDDQETNKDKDDLHSWHERSKFKCMRGQMSLDSETHSHGNQVSL